jgi:dTDP-4-dehydrorhamnose 3,5-epimerase
VTLSAENRRALYIPAADVAHGFLTLEDDTEVFYQMSAFYHPDSAVGVRWSDPAFGIAWPEPVRAISDRDASHPDFAPPARRSARA